MNMFLGFGKLGVWCCETNWWWNRTRNW